MQLVLVQKGTQNSGKEHASLPRASLSLGQSGNGHRKSKEFSELKLASLLCLHDLRAPVCAVELNSSTSLVCLLLHHYDVVIAKTLNEPYSSSK